MSAQDLEQRARELLAAEYIAAGYSQTGKIVMEGPWDAHPSIRAISAALRQQPAPVDLDEFREAVECWRDVKFQAPLEFGLYGDAEDVQALKAGRDRADHLLSIIDNAGKLCPCGEATCTESWEPGCGLGESVEHAVPAEREPPRGDELRAILARQPAPVVDDAMVQRALNARVRNWPIRQLFDSDYEARIAMRAALTVALAQGVQS